MGKRRTPLWVDRERTRVAADIHDPAECQALIDRHNRDLDMLVASGATREGAPRPMQQAHYYRSQALATLEARMRKLSTLVTH
ncbi:hypothetical protein [Methylobacterium aquaticum]|uniref:Uncharacterized protein n=1 Tax=Methylobacterium aquaticum TaxID=270351 RepID=A0A0C6G2J0_9HYPH|nr:hypothetical protein [Methylobacterium aquaticum]BAQ50340.1 hypothetical protein Maq22A_3p50450 [Methylobacterium aquaticum]